MVMLTKKSQGGRGRRRGAMAEINVTPFVDVMLVLLVVFMITAPMLASGVAVDLPKTKADPLPSADEQPLVVTVAKDGLVFVGTQEEPVEMEALAPMLMAVAQENLEKRVYVRGDQEVPYGKVMGVLSLLQGSGFRNAAMVVDPETAARGARGG
jgi:biopolymer transport protein TolR